MYTPAQVSEMLKIPPSTLRHYASLFTNELSDQTGRRHRLYTERDILVFAKIKELSGQNIPLNQIKPKLAIIEPEASQTDEAKRGTLALIPGISTEIESAAALGRSALSQLASAQTAIESQAEELAALSARMDQLTNYLSLPWWKRLFTRPPTL